MSHRFASTLLLALQLPCSLALAQGAGPAIKTLPTSLPITCNSRLGGVAAAPDGTLYISNFQREVWRVRPGGETTLLASNLQGSSGNTVFQGELLQSSFNDNRILRFDAQGKASVFATRNLSGPIGLAVNELDEVFVCNFKGNSLTRIDPDGASEILWQGGHLNGPNGITIGPEALPYVVNYNDAKVMRLTPEGLLEHLVTLPGAGNAHIAWAQGAFYVTKIADHQIYRVQQDGRFELFAGSGEPGLQDGPLAQCSLNAPNGIAASFGGQSLVLNDLKGSWKSQQPAELVLRWIDLSPSKSSLPLEPAAGSQAPGLQGIERGRLRAGEWTFDTLSSGPAQGELVMLLHGFPQTGYSYRSQLRALGKRGFRALAPDQRGYSAGARPLGAAHYGLSALAGDVIAMADALGAERFHLVGHDWGGAVAWLVAGLYPERLYSLSVLSTPHYAAIGAHRSDPGSLQSKKSAYMADLAAPGAELALLANDAAGLRSIYEGLKLSAEEVQVYLEALGTPEALSGALNWYRAMGTSSGVALALPQGVAAARASAPPVKVPTLYLWGSEDVAFARDCAEDSALFVEAPYRFMVLEGKGHWLPEEASTEVNEALLEQLGDHSSIAFESLKEK